MCELFWLFIIVSVVIMAETQARKCYDFKFKQAVIKKYAEKNNNPETARKNSGDETAAYI